MMPDRHSGKFAPRRLALAIAAGLAFLSLAFDAVAQDDKPLSGVALVIGQSKYEHLARLPNPANDADAIDALLSDLGFDSIRRTDRDASSLSRDLERFAEDAEDADVAVLYYSGHGIEAGGENYLIPVDADLSALDAAATRLVPVSALIEELKATVPVAIVMLDACRNNPFPEGALLRPGPGGAASPVGVSGLGAARSVEVLDEPSTSVEPAAGRENLGTVIAFAAEPGKVALDGDAGGNSPYAAAVLRHLDAMAGEEFGMVMRMVAEEVYLKTAGAQRPWINESLRRQLYFGEMPREPSGDEGDILRERRQLLLTIAALPQRERRQVESAAVRGQVPMDALYGMLRTLGTDAPRDPAALEKLVRDQTERLKSILAERNALTSSDLEIARLAALADRALSEGALDSNLRFREAAKARFLEISGQLDAAEEALRARRLEGGRVFAGTAQAHEMQRSFMAAAENYELAFQQVRMWDEKLAWSYKKQHAAMLAQYGFWHSDYARLRGSFEEFETALGLASGEARADERTETQREYGNALLALGEIQNTLGNADDGRALGLRAVAAFRSSLGGTARTRDPVAWAFTHESLGRALSFIGRVDGDVEALEDAVRSFRAALEVITPQSDAPMAASIEANLATPLSELGRRESGTRRLLEAVKAYDASMKGVDRSQDPVEWASRLAYFGRTLVELGKRERRPDIVIFGKKQLDTAAATLNAEGMQGLADLPAMWAAEADAALAELRQ